MDRISKDKRSAIMSKIKGKNTKPERALFIALRKANIYFRKHYKIIGNPDIAFPSLKIAVFIDGDFWHGYDLVKREDKLPEYWKEKIKRNIDRDIRNNLALKLLGWKVVRVWEHEILRNCNSIVDKISRIVTTQKTEKSRKI